MKHLEIYTKTVKIKNWLNAMRQLRNWLNAIRQDLL